MRRKKLVIKVIFDLPKFSSASEFSEIQMSAKGLSDDACSSIKMNVTGDTKVLRVRPHLLHSRLIFAKNVFKISLEFSVVYCH